MPENAATEVLYTVRGGLATLGPAMIALKAALDRRFVAWADEIGAVSMLYPTLMPAAELSKLDYFRNFPHLAVVASRVRPSAWRRASPTTPSCRPSPART